MLDRTAVDAVNALDAVVGHVIGAVCHLDSASALVVKRDVRSVRMPLST